jgi:hypothetical protein
MRMRKDWVLFLPSHMSTGIEPIRPFNKWIPWRKADQSEAEHASSSTPEKLLTPLPLYTFTFLHFAARTTYENNGSEEVVAYFTALYSHIPVMRKRSRYSDWLRAGWERGKVRAPVGLRIFSSPGCTNRLWGSPNFVSNAYQGILLGIKRQRREADRSPTSSEVKKMWIYILPPPWLREAQGQLYILRTIKEYSVPLSTRLNIRVHCDSENTKCT